MRLKLRFKTRCKKKNDQVFEELMFQLTAAEFENLMSQFEISSSEHGGRRNILYVFTEQGVCDGN